MCTKKRRAPFIACILPKLLGGILEERPRAKSSFSNKVIKGSNTHPLPVVNGFCVRYLLVGEHLRGLHPDDSCCNFPFLVFLLFSVSDNLAPVATNRFLLCVAKLHLFEENDKGLCYFLLLVSAKVSKISDNSYNAVHI